MERKEAIIELVQTEINYGNDLQILKEVRDQLVYNQSLNDEALTGMIGP